MRRGGFIENLLYTGKRVELSEAIMDGDCNFRILSELRDPCAATKSIWAHGSREAARRDVWRGIEKEKTRGDGTPLRYDDEALPKKGSYTKS